MNYSSADKEIIRLIYLLFILCLIQQIMSFNVLKQHLNEDFEVCKIFNYFLRIKLTKQI